MARRLVVACTDATAIHQHSETALLAAVRRGNAVLSSRRDLALEVPGRWGRMALLSVVLCSNTPLSCRLLEMGAAPAARDRSGISCTDAAAFTTGT